MTPEQFRKVWKHLAKDEKKNQSDALGKRTRIRQEDIELFKTSLLKDMK